VHAAGADGHRHTPPVSGQADAVGVVVFAAGELPELTRHLLAFIGRHEIQHGFSDQLLSRQAMEPARGRVDVEDCALQVLHENRIEIGRAHV
jgi:hypothetical protein